MIRISKDLLASARAPPRSLSLPCPVALSSSQSLPAVFGSFGTSPGTPTITAKYHTVPLFSSPNDSFINTIGATSSFKRVNRANPIFYIIQSVGTVLRKQLSSVFLDTEDAFTKILDTTRQSLESRSAAQDTASTRGFGCEACFDVGNERGYG